MGEALRDRETKRVTEGERGRDIERQRQFWVKVSLRAAGFNIQKFTIFIVMNYIFKNSVILNS